MNESIRVAQIIGKLWAGGVEMVVFNYYRAIDKNKIQFDFFYDADSTVEPPQELIDMGARFYKIPPYQNLFSYLKTLRKYFRENNYQIVHSHINTLSVFPLYAAWKEKIPVRIAHNHSVPGGNEFKRNAMKQILRRFSRIFPTDYFACSEKAGRWLFGNKNFDSGKVTVIKNAIDLDKFRLKDDEINQLKKENGLNNEFVIGHIGRFTYAKNHRFMIDIFEEINKRENAKLLLVGDGELHDEIISYIEEKGLSRRVILTGKVSNPEKYYNICDVVLVTSLFEGLSLTTVESQAAGTPVVVSEAVPQEAVISDGCFYMQLKNSPKEWAAKVFEIKGFKLKLDKRSEAYDISKNVGSLEKFYLKKS